MQQLFRQEVLDAKRTSWLGGVSLTQPVGLWFLTAAAVTVAFAVALFLTLGTYTRRSRVVGQLVPTQGLATVLAPATGVITRADIPEGAPVKAGETLVVVTVPRATVDSGDMSSAVAYRLRRRESGLASAQIAQRELFSAQASGLAQQLTAAQREFRQVQAEVLTRQEQARIANETLDRLRELQDAKYVSDVQVKQQEAAALAQRGETQVLQRQALSIQRTIAQLQQAIREVPGHRQIADATFTKDLALLEQERVEAEARGELVVRAPVAGLIATALAKQGQAVQAGQPLLSLLPGDGRLEAELLVPSRAIGFIETNDQVLLRYQAFPYQKFGHYQGRVMRISRSALGRGEITALNGNADTREPLYRVTVSLKTQTVLAYGRPEPLKPGMLLEADIIGERRRLIEWLLEPLYSLKGTVSTA